MQTGGNAVLSGQQKQNVPAGRVIKVVAARLSWTHAQWPFLRAMDLDINIGKDNEIFSSHWRLKAYIN